MKSNIFFYIFVFISIIFFYLYTTQIETFSINDTIPTNKLILKDYENISKSDYKIYGNINNCLEENPTIKDQNDGIIHLINWPNGMGSALTVFNQNAYYLNTINPNLIILPHFSENSENFKYYDTNYNNSFFLYFKYKHSDIDITKYKHYFITSAPISEIPFFEPTIPVISNETNKKYIEYFNKNFEINKN